VLNPVLARPGLLFGLCDGEDKTNAVQSIENFVNVIEKQAKNGGRVDIKAACTQAKVRNGYEFTVVEVRKGRIFGFSFGMGGIIVGKKNGKGWEAERMTGKGMDRQLEECEKIVVVCNRAMISTLSEEEIVCVAGKYWEMKNPNIASWELAERAKHSNCPICIVVFL
jgi:hypothetical protein